MSLGFLFLLLASTLAGCQRWWVKPDEIPGTWTLSADTRHFLPPEFQIANATFVFKSDKTFTASNVPADIFYGNSEKPRLITGTGQWNLTEVNSQQNISLSLKTAEPPPPIRIPGDSFLLYTERKDSVVALFYFIDDPDLGRKVIFTATQTEFVRVSGRIPCPLILSFEGCVILIS